MTEQELLADINAGEQDQTLWVSIHNSPGFADLKALYAQAKANQLDRQLIERATGWDEAKLNGVIATIDNLMLLGDNLVANAAARTVLLDKLKGHDFILKLIARELG